MEPPGTADSSAKTGLIKVSVTKNNQKYFFIEPSRIDIRIVLLSPNNEILKNENTEYWKYHILYYNISKKSSFVKVKEIFVLVRRRKMHIKTQNKKNICE